MSIQFIKQRVKHEPEKGILGDCWIACLATLMCFPYEAIPQFQYITPQDNAEQQVRNWLSYYYYKKKISVHHSNKPPEGYSMAIGNSPRFPGIGHVVIAFNGDIAFDPHPDETGLTDIWFYETIDPDNANA